MHDVLEQHDAVGLAELVQRGEVTPRELLEAAIARLNQVNPRLNAVITPMQEEARRQVAKGAPQGPLAGVPFLLKDIGALYGGVRYTAGSRYLGDYVPPADSELVTRYKRAGLVIFGKTNTPEYGLIPMTEPERFGPTENPWRPGLTAGGSSGGAAAAVAARVLPIAHASDGGGSIRIPASACGIFGLKPTRGRTPCGPFTSENWRGFAQDHAVSLTVRDSAALLDVSAGPEWSAPSLVAPPARPFLQEVEQDPPPLRIAVTSTPFLPGTVHPRCQEALEDAAALCEELGHRVEHAHPPVDPLQLARQFFVIICGETAAAIEATAALVGRRATARDHETATILTALLGEKVYSAQDYARAMNTLRGIDRDVRRFMRDYDVLLTPTLGDPPLPHGHLKPRGLDAVLQQAVARTGAWPAMLNQEMVHRGSDQVYDFIPFTPLANVTGQPSMSVPLFWTEDGLPIGTMFTGRFGDEATLFQLAGQLERARPWKHRRPPVAAG